jgi:hypothetical protein
MDANKKSSYSIWFYATGVLASGCLLGSAYYIYSLFQAEEELEENQQDKIQVIHEKMRENASKGKSELDISIAMQILTMTNNIAEETMVKKYSDLDNERREALQKGNEEAFEESCMKYLEKKQLEYTRASRLVLDQFPGYTEEDLQRVLQSVDPKVMEQYQQMETTELKEPILEAEKVKEIYKSYGDIFMKEMKKFFALVRSNSYQQQYEPQMDQIFMFKIMATKLKVDDLVFLKHRVTENEIKSLIIHHNLLNDPEIIAINRMLAQMQQQMDMPMES